MTSSSSSRRGKTVTQSTRKASPGGWINNDEEWIVYQGLDEFVQMKGECYPDLVEVFYTNLKLIDGVVYSRVEKSLFRIEKKVDMLIENHNISDSSIDESDDEDDSTVEDSMDMSKS
ncbi:hypothetical protein LR48_Vigan07g161500 [Vigna angularis]|uniref:Uncharacterized protein n=1 Tax=Phaseolus angularis TaxID=3914 RepID=A0A0L9UYY6_PHAAN|nr:hypothetical protein LR48_Vigan07g161500 [Vigna angularis]